MTTLLIVTWVAGLAQGPHAVLPVFPDPYLTDHEANPMGFLGLCSLISSMSVLQLEMQPLPDSHTMPDAVLGGQKRPSERQEKAVVCEAGGLQMQWKLLGAVARREGRLSRMCTPKAPVCSPRLCRHRHSPVLSPQQLSVGQPEA